LAGLAFVVVKALGGEEAELPAGTHIILPPGTGPTYAVTAEKYTELVFPQNCKIRYPGGTAESRRPESFRVRVPVNVAQLIPDGTNGMPDSFEVPKGSVQVIPGSSWGTFTIACTIPIALFVGLWMYRIRKGRIVEASVIGGVLTLGAVVLGASIPGSSLE